MKDKELRRRVDELEEEFVYADIVEKNRGLFGVIVRPSFHKDIVTRVRDNQNQIDVILKHLNMDLYEVTTNGSKSYELRPRKKGKK